MTPQKTSVASTSSLTAAAAPTKRQAKKARKLAAATPENAKPKKVAAKQKKKLKPPPPPKKKLPPPPPVRLFAPRSLPIVNRQRFACALGTGCQQLKCILGHPRRAIKGLVGRDRVQTVQSAKWCEEGLSCRKLKCDESHPNSRGSWDGTQIRGLRRTVEPEKLQELEVEERKQEFEEKRRREEKNASMLEKIRLEARTKSERKRDNRAEKARLDKLEQEAIRRIEEATIRRKAAKLEKEKLDDARRKEHAHQMMLEMKRLSDEEESKREIRNRVFERMTIELLAVQQEAVQERQKSVAESLKSVGKQLVSSHRHIWIDPSFAPVIWDDEDTELHSIVPLYPRVSLPALSQLIPPVNPSHRNPFPPISPQNPNVPPRNPVPTYPHRNPNPLYSARPNPPYPPRNPNPAFPPRHHDPAFPIHPTHGRSTAEMLERFPRGFDVQHPHRPTYQHRYSATYAPPKPPPRQTSELQQLQAEMVRMEAELARLRSGVKR